MRIRSFMPNHLFWLYQSVDAIVCPPHMLVWAGVQFMQEWLLPASAIIAFWCYGLQRTASVIMFEQTMVMSRSNARSIHDSKDARTDIDWTSIRHERVGSMSIRSRSKVFLLSGKYNIYRESVVLFCFVYNKIDYGLIWIFYIYTLPCIIFGTETVLITMIDKDIDCILHHQTTTKLESYRCAVLRPHDP